MDSVWTPEQSFLIAKNMKLKGILVLDANLDTVVLSMTYGSVSSVFMDLRTRKMDSRWTP